MHAYYAAHLEDWLDAHKEGLAKYSEQAGEAIHHSFKVMSCSACTTLGCSTLSIKTEF